MVVEDTIPPGTSFEEATTSQGIWSESGGVVSFDLGTVEVGQIVEISISVRIVVALSSDLVNGARAESSVCDPDIMNNAEDIKSRLNADDEIDLFFPQFADGTEGEIRFQTSLKLAALREGSSVNVEFFSPEGKALEIDLLGLGSGSAFRLELAAGESTTLESTAGGPIVVGYARVRGGVGLEGVLVFSQTDVATGVRLSETGVAVSQPRLEFSAFLDSIGDR